MIRAAVISSAVLSRAENFWKTLDASENPHELMRFSAFLGVFPFAGYLFSYTVVGKVWSVFPWIQTTLTVPPALIYAGMQWIFFVTFPALSALILESLISRWNPPEWNSAMLVTTYSMTPFYFATLFIAVPFVNRVLTVFAVATFLYLHYYGYRLYLGQSIVRSAAMTFAVMILFVLIRQMFVFAIGF